MKSRSLFALSLLLWSAMAACAEVDTQTVREAVDSGADWLNENLPNNVSDLFDSAHADEWQLFLEQVETALRSESLNDLARHLPEVRSLLQHLDAMPATKPYADWLRQRLDYYVVADEVARRSVVGAPKATRPLEGTEPASPPVARPKSLEMATAPLPEPADVSFVRDQDVWRRQIALRPAPSEAAALIPTLKRAFKAEGVPPEWVWLAEVESSLDPEATSPSGAVGLFQFMPDTARRFGLKTRFVDERTNPQKSAQAAARYLKTLHAQFGSWPLALAAYNTGEGYLSRTLKKNRATTFNEIASRLPIETQMYVPKVLATVHMREGIDPERLPPPVADSPHGT